MEGQIKRSKKLLAIRGLNQNHNHDLKNIFKGAAMRAAGVAGPFQYFYAALVAKGLKPPMARLNAGAENRCDRFTGLEERSAFRR